MKFEDLIEEDKNVPDDKRTMELLSKIANKVYGCMQFTLHCPSIHREGMVPVLDLNMFIGEDGKVKYQFYEKPCSNKFVIPYHSAHSNKMKMSVIVEEGLRHMRNCSQGMEFEVRRKVMERWSRKLQRSGYPATVRHQAIREAIDKFERICKVEDAGGRPIRRAREW